MARVRDATPPVHSSPPHPSGDKINCDKIKDCGFDDGDILHNPYWAGAINTPGHPGNWSSTSNPINQPECSLARCIVDSAHHLLIFKPSGPSSAELRVNQEFAGGLSLPGGNYTSVWVYSDGPCWSYELYTRAWILDSSEREGCGSMNGSWQHITSSTVGGKTFQGFSFAAARVGTVYVSYPCIGSGTTVPASCLAPPRCSASATSCPFTPPSPLSSGTSMQRVTSRVWTPDVKVVLFIHKFDPGNDCFQDLFWNKAIRHGLAVVHSAAESLGARVYVIEACNGLNASANTDPSIAFTSTTWRTFVESKEYRTYLHVSPMEVTCTQGRGTVKRFIAPTVDNANSGYTKIPSTSNPLAYLYDPADVYRPWQGHNYYPPRVVNNGTEVQVEDRRSSRIAHHERQAQANILGYDAPFVFIDFNEFVQCTPTGASISVSVGRTTFPTAYLYINDTLVDQASQAMHSDSVDGGLARFIVSGGLAAAHKGYAVVGPDGYGALGPLSMTSLHWMQTSK